MNKKTMKVCGAGTGVSFACCFGLLGFLLGVFGLTSAIAYVNAYGDFIFFPSFAIFATLFMYGLMTWRKVWYSYATSIVTVLIMIWFATFGLVYASLIFGGVLAALAIIKWGLRRP